MYKKFMMKKYFHDGLLQLALVLSLMRVDLHNYLNTQYDQDIQELILGPTSAFTQTRFHHQNWNHDVGGYVHPKHVDHHINDIFRDLHALGQYNRDQGVDIDAYLVSNPQAPALPSENANLSNETDPSNSDNNNNEQSNNGTASTATGTATGSTDSNTEKEEVFTNPIGAELTKEVVQMFANYSMLNKINASDLVLVQSCPR